MIQALDDLFSNGPRQGGLLLFGGSKNCTNSQPQHAKHDQPHHCDADFTTLPVAVGVLVDEGQQDQNQHSDRGEQSRPHPFDFPRDEFQEFEQEKEVPFWARDVAGIVGIRFGFLGDSQKGS